MSIFPPNSAPVPFLRLLLPVVLMGFLLCGCSSTPEAQGLAVVEAWQKHLREYKYDEAWALMDPTFAFSRYGDQQGLRLWSVVAQQEGYGKEYTRSTFQRSGKLEDGTLVIVMGLNANGPFSEFDLTKTPDGFRIVEIHSQVTRPLNR